MSSLNPDVLLEYMSALGRGQWQTFKAAAFQVASAEIDEEPPHWTATVMANHLSALGHVEFDFDGDLSWMVAPPVLASTPAVGPGRGILCGSRTSSILERVKSAARAAGAAVSTIPQNRAPSAVEVIAANAEILATVAAAAEIQYAADAAGRIARCLPDLNSMLQAAPESSLPQGFPIRRFSPGSQEWEPTDRVAGDGAYWFECYGRPEFRLVRRGSIKRVSRPLAIWSELARANCRMFTYEPDERRLHIPVKARLPALHERALVLCSGYLPDIDRVRRVLTFTSIPDRVAAIICETIQQAGEAPDGEPL